MNVNKNTKQSVKEVNYTSAPSFEWFLDENHPDNLGYCPVVLRQSYQGLLTDRKAGFTLLPTEWDMERRLPKTDIPNGVIYLRYMDRMMNEALEGFQSAILTGSLCYLPGLSLCLNKELIEMDGSYPIRLRYFYQGRAYYRATGISIREENWDELLGQPKAGFEGFRNCKQYLAEAYRQFVVDIGDNGFDESAEFGRGMYSAQGYPLHVGPFIRLLVNGMKSKEQYGNAKVYTTAFHLLEEHLPSMEVPFSALNEECITGMRTKLLQKGLKSVYIHELLRTVRAIWNKAISLGVANRTDYPFSDNIFKGLSLRTEHRALSKEEVMKVIAYRNKCNDKKIRLALDLFTFSYLCGGMPLADMALLKVDNIRDGIIEYTRLKTHGKIRVAIPKLAEKIINTYRSGRREYIFPILDDKRYKTVLQQRGATRRCMIKLNNLLKMVGEELGLPIALTTYVARHSFATVLQQEGVALELISEMMGHQELKTTKIYLAGLSKAQLLDIQNHLA